MRQSWLNRLSENDSHVVQALRDLDVTVYPTFTQYSTDMRLDYPTSNVDNRILSVTHTAGSYTPDQVKDLEAKVFIINTSTRGEIDMDVISLLRKKQALIAANSQGFVRIISDDGTLVYDEWVEKQNVLPFIDILKTDAVEAEIMTGFSDIEMAAQQLADWGAKEIVLTHQNGLLIFAKGLFYKAEFYPEKLVGRSGRGDTCLAAYTCKRLSSSAEEATIWAAAVTSLKMEAEGPIKKNITDVEALIKNCYSSLQD